MRRPKLVMDVTTIGRSGFPPSVRQRIDTVPSRSRVAMFIAAATIMALGMRITLPQGLTVGTVLAVVLIPFWWPVLRRFHGARAFATVGAVAVFSGVWLTEFSSQTHRLSTGLLLSNSLLIVGLVSGVGVMLWARTLMSDASTAAWFGAGLLLGISPQAGLFSTNPWKFGLSTAVTVLALAIAQYFRKRWLELFVLVALTAASAVSDARSSSAILALSVILTAWQLRPKRETRRATVVRFAVAVGAIGIVVYQIGQTLILDGYLGDAARERSVEQIDTSGSLLLGGRPELAATVALMKNLFLGYGAGVVPNMTDVTVAKTGMAAIGYEPNNGYVEGYMFGGRFELHSVFGDLWANFGIPGLVLAGLIAVLIIRGLGTLIPNGAGSAVLIYLSVRGLWNLLFGPLYGSSLLLIPMMALVLLRRADPASPADFSTLENRERRARRSVTR